MAVGGLDVNFNYSWPQGTNTQLGIVPSQIMPGIQEAFRYRTQMIRFVSKDMSSMVAQAGDTIVYEKLTGSPSVVDLTAGGTINFTSPFTITKDSIVLDRYIGFPFFVEELTQLLPTNNMAKWNAFLKATIDACTEYIETDIASLYASMTNTYNKTGGITADDFPILEDRISANSYDDSGPWFLFLSRYDWLNLTSDANLRNAEYSDSTSVLRQARMGTINEIPVFQLADINALRWRYIPDVDLTSGQYSTYNKLYHNILMNTRAIQLVPRRLGIPKINTNVMFVEVADPEAGLIYRIRFIFDGELAKPGWKILVEILYGIKLFYNEYAMDVTSMHQVA